MWIELLERGNSRSESYSTGRILGTTYTYPKCPGCARVLLRVHAHKARTTPDCATRLECLQEATADMRKPAISGLEEKMRRLRRSPSNHNRYLGGEAECRKDVESLEGSDEFGVDDAGEVGVR